MSRYCNGWQKMKVMPVPLITLQGRAFQGTSFKIIMWYLKEAGRVSIVDKTKTRRRVSKALHVAQLNFWRKLCTVTKQKLSEKERHVCFFQFNTRFYRVLFSVKTSVLTGENEAELASTSSINFISSRLTCHLTDWQYTKSLSHLQLSFKNAVFFEASTILQVKPYR